MDALFGARDGEVTAAVAAYAREQGLSERTVWRQLARARRNGCWKPPQRYCQRWGKPLPERSTVRRRFCTASCRARWHQNGAAAADSGAGSERAVTRAEVVAVHELLAFVEGQWPKPRTLDERAQQQRQLAQLKGTVHELVTALTAAGEQVAQEQARAGRSAG